MIPAHSSEKQWGSSGPPGFLPTAKKELRIICGTLFNSYWGTMSVCTRKCLLCEARLIRQNSTITCQSFSAITSQSKLFYANPAYFPKILNRSLKKTNTISAMKNISPIM